MTVLIDCTECSGSGQRANGMPCEHCEEGKVEAETFESITQHITDLLQWIKAAEGELAECTQYKNKLAFVLKQSDNSSFNCHYIGPDNAIFDDRERLSKYWVRVVKANIKDAKKQVQEAKQKLIEVI